MSDNLSTNPEHRRHPDTFFTDILHDSQGRRFVRFRAWFDHPEELIDPSLWPHLFSSSNSAHVSAAVVQTQRGKQLYWGQCPNVMELLKTTPLSAAQVRLESDLALATDDTNLPERWIRIQAGGSEPGAAADARELAIILIRSGVDAKIPLTAYAVHPGFGAPFKEAQILLDIEL